MKKNRVFRTKSDLIFYAALMALPCLQFAIFYFYVNFDSFALAFKKWDAIELQYTWDGFNNFKSIFSQEEFIHFLQLAGRSALFGCVSILVLTPLSLVFSYYIYKQKTLSRFFSTLLYLPNIISGAVVSFIFVIFLDRGVPIVVEKLFGTEIGPIFKGNGVFWSAFFFSFWFSFGTNVLMYTGAMKKIPESTTEAAQIDGASSAQEFFSIVIPQIFPTIITFAVITLSAMFTHEMSLFSMAGFNVMPPQENMGYYLYTRTYKQDETLNPGLAALGMVLTAVTSVLVFSVRGFLNKINPMGDK